MNVLSKPICRQFVINVSCFGLAVNEKAHYGKLKTHSKVIEKTSHLLVAFPSSQYH